MLKQTGLSYASAKHAKALFVAKAKDGKSSFLVASALGLLPWQKMGGVVDKPEHLHVLTFDSSALAGIAGFLTKTCKAPEAALAFNVYNFQDDARKVSLGSEWDFRLFQDVCKVAAEIRAKAQKGGTHVVIISSLTGLVASFKRALAGPVGNKRGSGMDIAKWDAFGSSIAELRNIFQDDAWHCFWEAHITTKQEGEDTKETVALQGSTGQNFAMNVEQVFRIRRQYTTKHPGSNCDVVYLETQPNIEFVANGRKFNECLEPKEHDLTATLHKLGLSVGGWRPTPEANPTK